MEAKKPDVVKTTIRQIRQIRCSVMVKEQLVGV
jgi:hypothetical protein